MTVIFRTAGSRLVCLEIICMAITQILGLVLQPGNVAQVLMIGLSLSTIAFGGTYAAVFFVTLAGSRRRRSQGITAAP